MNLMPLTKMSLLMSEEEAEANSKTPRLELFENFDLTEFLEEAGLDLNYRFRGSELELTHYCPDEQLREEEIMKHFEEKFWNIKGYGRDYSYPPCMIVYYEPNKEEWKRRLEELKSHGGLDHLQEASWLPKSWSSTDRERIENALGQANETKLSRLFDYLDQANKFDYGEDYEFRGHLAGLKISNDLQPDEVLKNLTLPDGAQSGEPSRAL